MRSARLVAERLASLYPGAQLLRRGVVHITLTVRPTGTGPRHVVAVGPHAPPSDSDYFALCATRARADALLTSAGNVRAEPGLQHDFPEPFAAGLHDYRASLGKREPPTLAILTASGDLPLEHGLWADGTRKLVITAAQALPAVTAKLGGRAEVVGLTQPSAAAAIALLQARGHGLVSLEAGPRTLAPLYAGAAPHAVDELLLHTYEATLPDPLGLGPALPSDAQLLAGLTCVGESTLREPSGPFRFAYFHGQQR